MNKIKTKKTQTAFWLIVFLFLLPLFSGSELTLQDIPAFPGSQLKYTRNIDRETLQAEFWYFLDEKLNHQEIGAKGVNVAETCVKKMKEKGWELKKENWQRRGGEFLFKKDVLKEVKVNVSPSKKAIKGRMKPYIFIKFELKRLIPFEDITGIDPPDVPRCPGSVRVRWMNLLGSFSEKYLVVVPLDKVKEFFEKELPKHGWQVSKGAATLNYIKRGTGSTGKQLTKEDIKKPLKMVKKLIPTTLSLRFNEKEGILAIGLGRDAGSGDSGKKEDFRVTPVKDFSSIDKKDKVVTTVDVKKDIPPYPGLEQAFQSRKQVTLAGEEFTKIRLEKKAAEMKEALDMADYYLKEMKKRGWQLADEEWHGIGRKLLFSKGAAKVKIEIKAVGRYPIPERARKITIPVEMTLINAIPTVETAGEDIEGIPRFPGSVRFYTLKAGIDHIVKFKAAACVEEVEWFFIEELPKKGWTFSGNDSTGLLFVPAATAKSAAGALSKGQLVPTTLKIKVDDQHDGTVKIGMDKTKGDS